MKSSKFTDMSCKYIYTYRIGHVGGRQQVPSLEQYPIGRRDLTT